MRRTRRRSRGTWLPTIGTFINTTTSYEGRELLLTPPFDGSFNTVITDLTFDRPLEGDAIQADDTLAQVVGSEYILQRNVGKVLAHRRIVPVALGSVIAADRAPAILLSCGFFVARANDDASGGGLDTPIGSASETERTSNYSPLGIDGIREPWIWRRTWILGSYGAAWTDTGLPRQVLMADQSLPAGAYPPSTALYGSLADGPHIDSKVKRRISQDDRLWFAASVCNWPTGVQVGEIPMDVTLCLDYRLFGSLRKAKNRSAF